MGHQTDLHPGMLISLLPSECPRQIVTRTLCSLGRPALVEVVLAAGPRISDVDELRLIDLIELDRTPRKRSLLSIFVYLLTKQDQSM